MNDFLDNTVHDCYSFLFSPVLVLLWLWLLLLLLLVVVVVEVVVVVVDTCIQYVITVLFGF